MKDKMTNLALKTLSLISLMSFGSCAVSVKQNEILDFFPYKSAAQVEFIRSKEEKFVVMGFSFNNSHVKKAREKFLNQCQEGSIQGISTKTYTKLHFLSWTEVIEIRGWCSKNSR